MQHLLKQPEQLGEPTSLCGWMTALREFKKFGFILLRSAGGDVQCVVSREHLDALATAECGLESVVRVTGTPVASQQAEAGWELQVSAVEPLSPVGEPLPVSLHHPELEAELATILNHAAVTNRHATRRRALEVAANVTATFRAVLGELGFTEVFTPKIVGSATEGGSNVFEVDYFGETAYLAQSPQFYKQAMVGVFGRVFEVGPVFRAEPHATRRHLNTYTSLDVELGFIENHTSVMEVAEEVVWSMIEGASSLVEEPPERVSIPRITFEEAAELAGLPHGATKGAMGGAMDLSPEGERRIGEWAEREHGSPFVFVTGYPMAKRPFYTHPDPAAEERSNSFDLLFRGTELITGGQRLHRYEDYLEALRVRGLSPEPFEGYLEAFRYGMPPHGGFAIGQERFVAQLLGLENVRQSTAFPRDIHRLTP